MTRHKSLLLVCAALCALGVSAAGFAWQFQAGRTRNPHGKLSMACEACHTSTGWKPIRSAPDFSHKETRYPLRGLHESVACRNCHISLVFTNIGMKCADCHADIHRRQFGARCEDCHTVRGWQVSSSAVKEHINRFPLLGGHASVECSACHTNAAAGRFVGLSTVCVSCHVKDYQAAVSPNHVAAKLPLTCDSCHQLDGWHGARFDHAALTGYPLVGAHARLECAACHVGNRFAGTAATCFGCHARDYVSAREPNHAASGFPKDCSTCHGTTTWSGAKFDHNTLTRFALTGAHQSVACAACHVAGRYAGTPANCFGCHARDFDTAANPNHRSGNFSTDCTACHTTDRWAGARFDHSLARFKLTGAHATLRCESCHAGGRFTGTPSDCASCHMTDYNRTKEPAHAAAGFAQTCENCHTTVQWSGAKFDHNALTKFPLTGAHISTSCTNCHRNGVYKGTSSDCASCHIADYNKAANPNHVASGFPTNCASCHSTAGWTGAGFDHSAATRFPLTGAHVQVACSDCHKNNVFKGTPADCASCHLEDYKKTANPNHVASGFPTDCASCHNTGGWKGATFDHNAATKFPLTGAHVQLGCSDCHKNNVFKGTPADCASCHIADFNRTVNPNHAAAGFPQDCSLCHTTTQWKGARFDHNAATRFQLTGAHVSLACTDCHKNNQFKGTPSSCVSCHLADFNRTTNPNHAAANFPQDCTVCHTTIQWKGATFNHNTATRFPLTGAHTTVGCSQCHVNNVYAGTPTDCAACHLNDYNNTRNPNHTSAGFPKDCQLCHSTTRWAGAIFDHSKTRFPLTGVHSTTPCSSCHVNNVYAGTATACYSCHAQDYNRTTNPAHAAAAFPQDCSLCHSTAGWQGATFDHSRTRFPLTGAHATLKCSDCHAGGQYANLPTACASCHLANFNSAQNPDHRAAGFPQDCAVCHSTSAWRPASFDHSKTRFPLTGAHVSTACVNCHVAGVYAGTPTDCYSCHQSVYNKTTNPNHAAAGFPRDCSMCHSTSAWTGAKFNHTGFPIYSGTHANRWTTCGDCHTNPGDYAVFSCVTCHEHNKTDMDNHHRDVRNYVYNSANCYACHPTGRSG